MEHKPRWAEMCAHILQQCEVVRGSRDSLATFLEVDPNDLAIWLAAKSGPPRPVFEKAMEIILAEHDRRFATEQAAPRRRKNDG